MSSREQKEIARLNEQAAAAAIEIKSLESRLTASRAQVQELRGACKEVEDWLREIPINFPCPKECRVGAEILRDALAATEGEA